MKVIVAKINKLKRINKMLILYGNKQNRQAISQTHQEKRGEN